MLQTATERLRPNRSELLWSATEWVLTTLVPTRRSLLVINQTLLRAVRNAFGVDVGVREI